MTSTTEESRKTGSRAYLYWRERSLNGRSPASRTVLSGVLLAARGALTWGRRVGRLPGWPL